MSALTSRGSAARAMLRLAGRDAWRNRGRSALIALMVALPVLCLSAVSVIYRSDQRDPQDWVTLRLGAQAQAWVRFSALDAVMQTVDGSVSTPTGTPSDLAAASSLEPARARLAGLIPASDRLVPDRSEYGGVQFGGRSIAAQLREFDYPAVGSDGPVRQVSGRPPRSTTEVVVSQILARRQGLRIGDRLSCRSDTAPARSLTVVGVVGGFQLIGQAQVIGLPGSMLPADLGPLGGLPTWLVLGPAPVDAKQVAQLNRFGFTVTSRAVIARPLTASQPPQLSDSSRGPLGARLPLSLYLLDDVDAIGVITVAIGLALLQIALLAGPAIAVGARRNERTLALLAASGGGPRQLRSMVLVGTGVVGLVGCLLAAGLGAGLGVLAVPLLRRYADQQLVRTDVHLLDLLVLVLVGTGTAVAAAMLPARLAARMNVVDTLTGRRALVSPARRVPVVGLLTLLVGSVVCYLGATGRNPLITVIGIAVAEIGLVTLTGTIIAWCARLAGRLPFSARFALRDAVRQRSRTAPAVAAVMAAIAGTIAAGVFVTAQDDDGRFAYLQSSSVGVVTVDFQSPPDTKTQAAVVADLRRTLPIQQVAFPQRVDLSTASVRARPAPGSKRSYRYNPASGLYHDSRRRALVDDGTVLQVLTGVPDPAARAGLAAGKVVLHDPSLLWPDGTAHLQVDILNSSQEVTSERVVPLPAVLSSARPGLADPVLPASSLKLLGVTSSVVGVVADTTRMPTEQEEQNAAGAVNALAPSEVTVERGYQARYSIGLLALVVAAAIIALGGTFSAVGLAAAESRADVSTLAAIGAGPAVRRRLAAAQAGVITVLGGTFGLFTGLLAGWALVRLRGYRYLGPSSVVGHRFLDVPWTIVLSLAFGVPLLAIVLAYLTARSRLPLIRRLGQ